MPWDPGPLVLLTLSHNPRSLVPFEGSCQRDKEQGHHSESFILSFRICLYNRIHNAATPAHLNLSWKRVKPSLLQNQSGNLVRKHYVLFDSDKRHFHFLPCLHTVYLFLEIPFFCCFFYKYLNHNFCIWLYGLKINYCIHIKYYINRIRSFSILD